MGVKWAKSVAGICSAPFFGGCATTDTGPMPVDAATQLVSYINDAREAARARAALHWEASSIRSIDLASPPADIGEFKRAACDGVLYGALIVVRQLTGFNSDVTDLAKAPDDSFAAYMESIHRHKEAIKDAQAKRASAPSAAELVAKERTKCEASVERDLGVDKGNLQPQNVIAIATALQALLAVAQKGVQIYESKERAEAVKAYVAANQAELDAALDALGEKGGLMQESLDLDRRLLLRKAYVAYSEASNGAPGLARVHAGEDYARYIGQYMKIRDLDGKVLIEDSDEGLRAAYKQLVAGVLHPNSNPLRALDNFLAALKNLTGLHDAVGDFNDARKAAAG